MKEISFSIPVSGVVRINANRIEIIVNKAETTVEFEEEAKPGMRISFERGMTMFDLILESTRSVVRTKGANRFSAAELYHEALMKYPQLKRNSFMSRVISCARNHPSYKHYASGRDYFRYSGGGQYQLHAQYLQTGSEDSTKVGS